MNIKYHCNHPGLATQPLWAFNVHDKGHWSSGKEKLNMLLGKLSEERWEGHWFLRRAQARGRGVGI